MTTHHQFTSESVTEGHPDKLADQIADNILDAALHQDPTARVAVEVLLTTGLVHIAGEITTTATLDVAGIARSTLRTVGYTPEHGLDPDACAVLVTLDRQSPDIAAGVSRSLEARTGRADAYDLLGAGDQGLMFGYACDETPELMPAPIAVSHALARRLTHARRSGLIEGLRPDGKTQVTFTYDESGIPTGIDTVVVSTQHDPGVSHLDEQVRDQVVRPVLSEAGYAMPHRLLVNPSGQFIIGGPVADTGLTGRKLAVDTYGGAARHGGGALSGKDPSKVDRSATYATRWVAKNVVATGLAARCEVQVAYAIGSAHPVGLYVNTFGTCTIDDRELTAAIRDVFDLRPAAIIDALDLRRPIYGPLAAYGHLGHDHLPWEQTNRTGDLLAALV